VGFGVLFSLKSIILLPSLFCYPVVGVGIIFPQRNCIYPAQFLARKYGKAACGVLVSIVILQ